MVAMRRRFYLLGSVLLPLVVFAQKQPGEAASIQKIEIKGEAVPGGKVAALIKVQLAKGYHVHSNKPSDPKYFGTGLTLALPAGVTAGTIDYPKGKVEKLAGLDKPLSVYEEQFEISVPLGLSASVKAPLIIP